MTLTGSVNRVRPEKLPDIDENEMDENGIDENDKENKSPPRKKVKTAKELIWKKEDINITPLPDFEHIAPLETRQPIEYLRFFYRSFT